jgi:hypothetical protein
MGTKIFNGLPPELKNVKNVMLLRRNLKIIFVQCILLSSRILFK